MSRSLYFNAVKWTEVVGLVLLLVLMAVPIPWDTLFMGTLRSIPFLCALVTAFGALGAVLATFSLADPYSWPGNPEPGSLTRIVRPMVVLVGLVCSVGCCVSFFQCVLMLARSV